MAKSSSSLSQTSNPSIPSLEGSTPAADAPPLPATYEAALSELESLVSRLDSGQMPLDQLLVSYQRGAQLLAFCKEKLASVEEQVKVLEGNELKPWKPS